VCDFHVSEEVFENDDLDFVYRLLVVIACFQYTVLRYRRILGLLRGDCVGDDQRYGEDDVASEAEDRSWNRDVRERRSPREADRREPQRHHEHREDGRRHDAVADAEAECTP